jgi:NAD(P)-dependent dehydrogenase (short-subunit alcohol dehydrogenase family)
MKLKDQVAIVTGAGRNIGEEVAKLFAAEGARIAVVDLDRPRGQHTVDAIKAQGGDAELFVTDVSKSVASAGSTSWSTTLPSPTTRACSTSPRRTGTG